MIATESLIVDIGDKITPLATTFLYHTRNPSECNKAGKGRKRHKNWEGRKELQIA